jgi:hypothetical protein
MRLRPYRRNLVVWRRSAAPGGRYQGVRLARLSRGGRIRRRIRVGMLLAVVGVLRMARAVRPCWKPLLAGIVLTAAGIVLRKGPGSILYFPGVLCLLSALFTSAMPQATSEQHSQLERELAGYSTPAQRRDLEAILDRYPDGVTAELRAILSRRWNLSARPR